MFEIVLIRHGRSGQRVGVPIPGHRFEEWQRRYDEAGIDPASRPRAEAIDAARKAAAWVASDLRRAVESAAALCPGRPLETDPIYREGELPSFASGPRLPALAWAWAARLAWMLGAEANAEPLRQARIRARVAAERLEDLAERHGSVALVGHGVMNGLIGTALRRRGWRGPRRPASPHWGVARFVRS